MKINIYIIIIFNLLGFGQAVADINQANQAFENRKYDDAIKLYQAEINNPDHSNDQKIELSWRYGQSLLAIDEVKDAYEHFEEAIKKYPLSAENQYWYGAASGSMAKNASIFSALGYAKKCRKAFENAVKIDPNYIDARQALMSFHLQAPGIAGGDKDVALIQANAIMKLDRVRGYGALISTYRAQDKMDDVGQLANEMVEEFPNSVDSYFVRGAYYRGEKQFEKAYADFDYLINVGQGLEKAETNLKEKKHIHDVFLIALYQLGAVASQGEIHTKKSIGHLETLIAFDEFTDDLQLKYAQYYLATLYKKSGNKVKASALTYAALKGLKDRKLKKKLKKLKKILKRKS